MGIATRHLILDLHIKKRRLDNIENAAVTKREEEDEAERALQ